MGVSWLETYKRSGKGWFLFLVGESSYFLVFLSRATEKSKAKIPFDQASFKCPFFCAYFLLAEFLALISFYLLPIPSIDSIPQISRLSI